MNDYVLQAQIVQKDEKHTMDDMLNGKQSRAHLQEMIIEVQGNRLAREAKAGTKKPQSMWRNLLSNILSTSKS